MSRPDSWRATIEATARWAEACWINDGSVFSADALWTPTLIEAEMLFALLLFPSNIKPQTKRRQVDEIWALAGEALDMTHPLLTDAVLVGIGSGGPGFNNNRWREMVFMIALSKSIKQLERAQRERVVHDYDAFMLWIDGVGRDGDRQFRHMLRFLLFPNRVERMSSIAVSMAPSAARSTARFDWYVVWARSVTSSSARVALTMSPATAMTTRHMTSVMPSSRRGACRRGVLRRRCTVTLSASQCSPRHGRPWPGA